jgi:hypothetical protein
MDKRPSQREAARNRMMRELGEGLTESEVFDCSKLSILARGCDPQMALRASKMLAPLLGEPELVSCTDDDDFIAKLQARKWSVVFFAPGACRYSAANMPIPGARPHTRGWSLTQYRALVTEHQGEGTPVVETMDERDIIPLLKQALRRSLDKGPFDTPPI